MANPFSGTEAEIKAQFKKLALIHHPDHGGSAAAFDLLVKQRDQALGIIPTNSVMLGRVEMKYITNPAPNIWVGASSIVYKANKVDVNLGWPRFANDKMRAEFEGLLPIHVKDLGEYQVYRRHPDQILMSDLIRMKGPIAPEHVSWMISRMLNLACYLQFSGVSLVDIGSHNLLVNLQQHWVMLTGPLPFVTPLGKRPKTAPARTIGVFPSLLQKNTVATPKLDLMLIRSTAKELLGDRGGSRLRSRTDIRPEIVNWLIGAPQDDAFKDFEAWGKALGERRFVKFDTTAQEIYNGWK